MAGTHHESNRGFLLHGRGLRLPPSVALQADILIFRTPYFWRTLQSAGSQLDTGPVQKQKRNHDYLPEK